MSDPSPQVRQNRLAAIRRAVELGHVGGNEDTEWLLEEVDRLEALLRPRAQAIATLEREAQVAHSCLDETRAKVTCGKPLWERFEWLKTVLVRERDEAISARLAAEATQAAISHQHLASEHCRAESENRADGFRMRMEAAEAQLTARAQAIATLTAERDGFRKDAAYHADCRPNRRQAEAAMADAKATNDRWADEVAKNRELEAHLTERAHAIAELQAALEEITTACEVEFAGSGMDEFSDEDSVGGLTFGMIHRARALLVSRPPTAGGPDQ